MSVLPLSSTIPNPSSCSQHQSQPAVNSSSLPFLPKPSPSPSSPITISRPASQLHTPIPSILLLPFKNGRPRLTVVSLLIASDALLPLLAPSLTMARSPVSYSHSQYYLPSPREESPYSSQPIILHHPHPVPQQQMQQPPHPDIPIDPTLAMYGGYYPFQQQPQHMLPPHLNMTANLSSPSSHDSELVLRLRI
ncbi:hypothetical protein NM688_g8815 [Phlebia brevispora]|uniref:Uncharacterized protein n=1 Tax=Phlebia brevispora TaxID=194682 RepID=A0ACC1RPN4_9APHY|nr:hypothetical protein NM688_g8815 [Phlebia brevispora]